MRIVIHLFFISLWLCIAIKSSDGRRRDHSRRQVIVPEVCPVRADKPLVGRVCTKPCVASSDCRSMKKQCMCDGDCGLSCIKHNQECVELAAITHGRVQIYPNNKFGAVAKYSCHQGYRLRGDKARVCQGDQSWSGSDPQCVVHNTIEKVECVPPPEIPNAVHDGSYSTEHNPFKLGTMLLYKCEPNFELNRDAVVRAWCVDSAEWVGPNMTCQAKTLTQTPKPALRGKVICPALEDIENGWVTQDQTSVPGSTATYNCQRGLHLAGRPEITCTEKGTWSGREPSCEKVTCGKPPTVENAALEVDVTQEMFPSGKQLTYVCKHGFHAAGQRRAMCSGEGDWIGLTLVCSPQSCGHPGDIKDGWRTGYAFTYPNKVNFFCHDGFQLRGISYRICQADGTWSDREPTCEPVRCPTLFAPHYGKMIGSGTSYGTVIRFECDNGYKLAGASERRCQADRSWSGEKVSCEEINCGWPRPFYNGYLIGHKTTVGSSMFYNCHTRATFDGIAFESHCLETGEWSDPPPTCWSQCQVPIVANATLYGGREQTYVDHGTELQFNCTGGLVSRQGSVMKCYNGTWSNKPECVPPPCPRPPPHVLNGLRVFMGRDHGFRAKYKCFAGHRLRGMNGTYLTCNFGNWKGGTPFCEEFFCPNPGTIANGQIKKQVRKSTFNFPTYVSSIRHGDKLVYECDDGYRLNGPSGATCVNGDWQPPLASRCDAATHPPFRQIWQPVPNMND